jgi:plastocyanin
MRTLLVVLAGLSAVTLAPAPATAATVNVRILAGGFSPTSVTVATGDSVTWRNADRRNHQVVADNGTFASPILRPGQSYTFTFRAAGTYRYRDALEPSERGTIRVTGPPPSVSLGATVPILVHGSDSHLQGTVSNQRAGEQVAIFAQPYGQASYVHLATVVTIGGGIFDYVVKPTVLTNYQVRWRTATSQPVTVQIRPKITLLPGRRGWFLARVTAAKSFAGRWVYLQRRTQFGQWVSVARWTLGPNSGKLFRIPRTAGTYRIFMTVNQAGAGYLEGWSGTQRVGRR